MALLNCSFSVCIFDDTDEGERRYRRDEERAFTRVIYELTNQHSFCTDSRVAFLQALRSCHTPPGFFPCDTTCQSIAAQANTMHAISAVQYYALQCTALPPNNDRAVRESHTYMRICIIHTCAQKRNSVEGASMHWTRIIRHRTTDPAPKPNQPRPYPSHKQAELTRNLQRRIQPV